MKALRWILAGIIAAGWILALPSPAPAPLIAWTTDILEPDEVVELRKKSHTPPRSRAPRKVVTPRRRSYRRSVTRHRHSYRRRITTYSRRVYTRARTYSRRAYTRARTYYRRAYSWSSRRLRRYRYRR